MRPFYSFLLKAFSVLSIALLVSATASAQSTAGTYDALRLIQPGFAGQIDLDKAPEVIEVAAFNFNKKKKKRANNRGRVRMEAIVDLSQQRMRILVDGRTKHTWKVSSGRAGHRTPTGTWKPTRMYRKYFSKKYNGAPMPNAVFFYGGYAVHGTYAVKRLGRVASHGCIRLSPKNSSKFYDLVKLYGKSNTRIKIVR